MTQKPSNADHPSSVEERVRLERRRAFLKQAGIVAGGAVAASWAGLAPSHWPGSLADPDGEGGKPKRVEVALPAGGYGVAPSAVHPVLGIAHGTDINGMVRAAVDAIGGIERFIERGDVVVIKPNVAFDRAAPLGATTHPETLGALVRLVRGAGAAEIRVVDNPIESPETCFERTGIRAAAVRAGARVYLPGPNDFSHIRVPESKWLQSWPFFWRPFVGATKVIGVAPVKDHNLCEASMTTKNWYGLLGGRRNQFHQDIHGIIADLARMMRPTFVMLDGTRVLYRSGPTGGSLDDVRAGNTVVASTDSVAVDAYGWDALLARQDKPRPAYLAMAHQQGFGNPDWKNVFRKEVQAG